MDAQLIAMGPVGLFSGGEGPGLGLLALCFGLIDLPLSLGADTLMLPWTLPQHFDGQRQDFRALIAAIEAGDLARAQSLAHGKPRLLRLKAEHDRTPLHLAVAKGEPELVEWIASETAGD